MQKRPAVRPTLGSSANTVSSYVIRNGDGKDVTDTFTKIKLADGTLTVEPAKATVTTGSASKSYDGTPLTSTEASITGLVNGETAAVTATGTITEVGTAENTYSITWGTAKEKNYTLTEKLGTLEITENAAEVTFTAPSAVKTYDGTPLTASAVTAEGLPDGFTFSAETSGSQTDAGSSANTVSSYVIRNGDGKDVTDTFTKIKLADGTLTVEPAKATVTTGSASKGYDGTPLTSTEASITGLVNGETATVTATGTITEVGTAENTYSITWGTAKEKNYTLTEKLGTLEITEKRRRGHLHGPSAVKTYDGTPLTASAVTAEGLPDGFTFSAETSGSQTDAGSSANTVSSYVIRNGDGKDVTDTFTKIKLADGTLTVEPAKATVRTGSASKGYDGTPLTGSEASITGLVNGETATVTATGTITEVGTAENTYSITWGTAEGENYTLTEKLGTLEITENAAEVTSRLSRSL